jgi:hypothetical protein
VLLFDELADDLVVEVVDGFPLDAFGAVLVLIIAVFLLVFS